MTLTILTLTHLTVAACSGDVPSGAEFALDTGSAVADSGSIGDADTQTTADSTVVLDASGSPSCHAALDCLLQKKLWKPGDALPKSGDCMAGIKDDQAMEIDALLGCVKTVCKTEFDAFYAGTAAQLPAVYGCMIEQCAEPLVVCVGGEGASTCLESLQCMQQCSPTDASCTVPCLQATTPYQSKKLGGVMACIFKDCTLAGLPACSVLQTCGAQCVLGG